MRRARPLVARLDVPFPAWPAWFALDVIRSAGGGWDRIRAADCALAAAIASGPGVVPGFEGIDVRALAADWDIARAIVVGWSGAPERMRAQVLEAFDRAIALLEEKGGEA